MPREEGCLHSLGLNHSDSIRRLAKRGYGLKFINYLDMGKVINTASTQNPNFDIIHLYRSSPELKVEFYHIFTIDVRGIKLRKIRQNHCMELFSISRV